MLESLDSAETFRRRYGPDISGHLDLARQIVRQTLDLAGRVGATAPWSGYLAVDEGADAVIGACGFKGNPAADASVEIAYFTFPPHEGRGHATAMARELVSIARGRSEVKSVVAHTLPEANASTHLLRKIGFEHIGDVVDPEDGPVWRWRLGW